jgi:hypothetical protein
MRQSAAKVYHTLVSVVPWSPDQHGRLHPNEFPDAKVIGLTTYGGDEDIHRAGRPTSKVLPSVGTRPAARGPIVAFVGVGMQGYQRIADTIV